MAHFGTEKGSKMAESVFFSKMTLDHLECSTTHFAPLLRLFVAMLRLHLAPNPLEMPHFGIKRGPKGAKNVVSHK